MVRIRLLSGMFSFYQMTKIPDGKKSERKIRTTRSPKTLTKSIFWATNIKKFTNISLYFGIFSFNFSDFSSLWIFRIFFFLNFFRFFWSSFGSPAFSITCSGCSKMSSIWFAHKTWRNVHVRFLKMCHKFTFITPHCQENCYFETDFFRFLSIYNNIKEFEPKATSNIRMKWPSVPLCCCSYCGSVMCTMYIFCISDCPRCGHFQLSIQLPFVREMRNMW